MKDFLAIFKHLGFTESEGKVYLFLLEHGPSTVLDIQKTIKLSRQTIYTSFDDLVSKGVVSTLQKAKKKLYAAEDPEKILLFAKRREAELQTQICDIEGILPELKLKQKGERPTVKMVEGKEGLILSMTNSDYVNADKVYEIVDLETLFSVLSKEDMQSVPKLLQKVATTTYGIYAGKPAGKTLKSKRFFLPKEMRGFKSGIALYGNKLEIQTYTGKIFTIFIEQEFVAKTFRILFELALKGAKDLPSD